MNVGRNAMLDTGGAGLRYRGRAGNEEERWGQGWN